jgi:phosphatidylglycerol:prolipoprotein diacylglycerol transferase
MRRILFNWNGFNVRSYPSALYLGLVAGVFTGAYFAPRSGIDPDRFALATVILLIPMMIGARLFFVLMHWKEYRQDISRIWRRTEGGMVTFGGLVAGVAFSIPLLGIIQLPVSGYWDAAVMSFLVALLIAKLGCFLNGCCAGRPTEAWCGINLPDHDGVWRRRFPTQILEMVSAAALFGFAVVVRDRAPFAGATALLVATLYSASRGFVEGLRDATESRTTAIVQATSVLFALVALGGFILARLWQVVVS